MSSGVNMEKVGFEALFERLWATADFYFLHVLFPPMSSCSVNILSARRTSLWDPLASQAGTWTTCELSKGPKLFTSLQIPDSPRLVLKPLTMNQAKDRVSTLKWPLSSRGQWISFSLKLTVVGCCVVFKLHKLCSTEPETFPMLRKPPFFFFFFWWQWMIQTWRCRPWPFATRLNKSTATVGENLSFASPFLKITPWGWNRDDGKARGNQKLADMANQHHSCSAVYKIIIKHRGHILFRVKASCWVQRLIINAVNIYFWFSLLSPNFQSPLAVLSIKQTKESENLHRKQKRGNCIKEEL